MKFQLPFLSPTLAVFGPALLAAAVLSACSASKWHEVPATPQTISPLAEKETPPSAPLRVRDPGFVKTETPAKKVDEPQAEPSIIGRNDEIVVTDTDPKGEDGSVEAVVVHSDNPDLKKDDRVIIPKTSISREPVDLANNENAADKYFVIQNIATEKLRVYRNCVSRDKGGECQHKLVFETEMAAGQDTPQGRSLLGSFRITKWFKFYEDKDHSYPSFQAPGYPMLPAIGEDLSSWLDKTRLPSGRGLIRGSFGWYTAYLGPNANEQWTHGTLGWGDDGGKFIKAAKDPANAPGFMRSLGCTRVENQAIALMREILPVGTKVVKVYAKESLADESLIRYENLGRVSWNWIIAKSGTMSETMKSGAPHYIAPNDDDILDRGAYRLDQKPTVAKGNLYKIDAKSFKGTLLVDEGRLEGYAHPSELKVGGMPDHKLPALMIAN